jgi:hypothetical protein
MIITLMMEAVRTSETLVNSYQCTPRYKPEDSHLCTHRRENLKSHSVNVYDLLLFRFYVVKPNIPNKELSYRDRYNIYVLILLFSFPVRCRLTFLSVQRALSWFMRFHNNQHFVSVQPALRKHRKMPGNDSAVLTCGPVNA